MEQAEELQAIHDRHMDVNNEQIDLPIAHEREAPRCVGGHENLPPPFGVGDHQVPDDFQEAGIVIDEHDRCAFGCHALRQPAGNNDPRLALAPATFGSVIVVEDSGFPKKKNQAA